jgi:hypothetical protein
MNGLLVLYVTGLSVITVGVAKYVEIHYFTNTLFTDRENKMISAEIGLCVGLIWPLIPPIAIFYILVYGLLYILSLLIETLPWKS